MYMFIPTIIFYLNPANSDFTLAESFFIVESIYLISVETPFISFPTFSISDLNIKHIMHKKEGWGGKI